MKILLDTHAFVWAGSDAARLSRRARAQIRDRSNELLLSVASAWELAIKARLGKVELRIPLKDLVVAGLRRPGFSLQPIELQHVLAVQDLPLHHRDPFDRLLVAQAQAEKCPILSRDPAFDAYGVDRIW